MITSSKNYATVSVVYNRQDVIQLSDKSFIIPNIQVSLLWGPPGTISWLVENARQTRAIWTMIDRRQKPFTISRRKTYLWAPYSLSMWITSLDDRTGVSLVLEFPAAPRSLGSVIVVWDTSAMDADIAIFQRNWMQPVNILLLLALKRYP